MTTPTVTPQPAAWLYAVEGWSHCEARINPRNPLPPGWTKTPLYTREQTVAEVVAWLRDQDGHGEWSEAADAIEREWSAA